MIVATRCTYYYNFRSTNGFSLSRESGTPLSLSTSQEKDMSAHEKSYWFTRLQNLRGVQSSLILQPTISNKESPNYRTGIWEENETLFFFLFFFLIMRNKQALNSSLPVQIERPKLPSDPQRLGRQRIQCLPLDFSHRSHRSAAPKARSAASLMGQSQTHPWTSLPLSLRPLQAAFPPKSHWSVHFSRSDSLLLYRVISFAWSSLNSNMNESMKLKHVNKINATVILVSWFCLGLLDFFNLIMYLWYEEGVELTGLTLISGIQKCCQIFTRNMAQLWSCGWDQLSF